MKPKPFDNLQVDHIHFYVADVAATADRFVAGYGLAVYAVTDPAEATAAARSAAVGGGQIRLLLTQALAAEHPGAAYVSKHGDGVTDIALRVPDAAAAFGRAVQRGATPVSRPASHDGIVTASILGFGDVIHTFVQRADDVDERALPGMALVPGAASDLAASAPDTGLAVVDHFAVCVAPGETAATVNFYKRVLDFDETFVERIVIGSQAIIITVVQSKSRAVTYTIIEPEVTQASEHISEFLSLHEGPGVQHIAFTTGNIVRTISEIKSRGVEFLSTPAAYYELLEDRLGLAKYSVAQLQQHDVLVDEDHHGQLFQIFTKSVHPRGTLFFEVIERVGARSFGAGNITALYSAVELQRAKEGAITS
jgi:4-hydroxymandelate synthase